MKIKQYTDTELLDYLQSLNNKSFYSGRCILRMSSTGRGWRLHESELIGSKDVRGAIIEFMRSNEVPDDHE